MCPYARIARLKKTYSILECKKFENFLDKILQAAEMAKKRLNDINPKNLSADDKKIRTQLIKEQNDIIKGNKPKTPTSVLKSLGLRALPAVGAFIAMFSSTPAYGQGGKVCRGRSAQGSAEKS